MIYTLGDVDALIPSCFKPETERHNVLSKATQLTGTNKDFRPGLFVAKFGIKWLSVTEDRELALLQGISKKHSR